MIGTGTASFWRTVVAEDGALKLANLVTLSRGLLILPVAALEGSGHARAALWLYCIAASTDLFDGWLARRSGRASPFGAQLDAVIDNLFSMAIFGFLVLAYPGLASRHAVALAILFGAPIAYLALSWLLTRRFMMFHFWSAKAGAFLLFCLWPLVAVTRTEVWLPVSATMVGLSRLEQIIFMLRGGDDLNAVHGLSAAPPPAPLEIQS